jgi:chromosome segregation protein
MYLKRLEIQGFKSFANKTVLDFLSPKSGNFSITAIVGPNGSGKSNIVDAIRWVMGEQSIKNLRGKKNEDIIFSGSETKGKQGMAEVIMVLDNADKRTIPEYEEIVITRRLYRSGESEYLFNGAPSRLFDIRLVLAQAQFAEGSYGIVGQGMIDRLLISSSAERKDFIDEASGIKEFQLKRHKADLKLHRTWENMNMAESLLDEVEPRLKLLKNQVKKLEKRQSLQIDLTEAQEIYYSSVYLNNHQEMEKINKDLAEKEVICHDVAERLAQTQTELATLARAASRQEVYADLQNKYNDVQQQKNDLEKQSAILDGQIHTEYGKIGQQNISWLENKAQEVKIKKDKIDEELDSLNKEAVRVENELTALKKEYDDQVREKTEKMVKISRVQEALSSAKSDQTSMQVLGLTTVSAILNNKKDFGQVYGTVADLGAVPEEYCVALDAATGGNLSAIVVGDDDVARLAINYLREKRLGRATFLPLNKIEGRETYSQVEALLTHPDVLGEAMNFIKFEAKFYHIFSFILNNTLIVRDLQAAQRVGIGQARMVTLDGDIVERHGVMKGGYNSLKQSRLSFAGKLNLSSEDSAQSLQSQLILLNQELDKVQNVSDEVKEKIYQNEIKKQTLASKIELIQKESNLLTKEISGFIKELSLSQMTPEQYGEQVKELTQEKEEIKEKKDILEKELFVLAKKLKDFNEDEEAKKQKVFDLQEQMQIEQIEFNTATSSKNELRISLAKIETKQESLNEEVKNELGAGVGSIAERYEEMLPSDEWEAMAEKIQKLKYQLSLIGGIDPEVSEEYETTNERFNFLFDQLSDLKKATGELEKMIAELDGLMKKKRSEAFKKIRKEFSRYFKILFDGGQADLLEVYGEENEEIEKMEMENSELLTEEDMEEIKPKRNKKILTGIDITANPPGKKIKSINALSGGERTLTSIALICAILNGNPSPFVVMDEVEAALDEANTVRFAKILSELATKSQFIVITHNRVTMHSASALYGVTMANDGISKLLSVKMEELSS